MPYVQNPYAGHNLFHRLDSFALQIHPNRIKLPRSVTGLGSPSWESTQVHSKKPLEMTLPIPELIAANSRRESILGSIG